MKQNHSYGVTPNHRTNEQHLPQDIYDEVEMPEIHTYEKARKSKEVQSPQKQKRRCGYWLFLVIMAIIVVLITILVSIILVVASVDLQAFKDSQVACLELPELENGSITMTPGLVHRGIGSTASYSCNQGYYLVGIVTRHCVYKRYYSITPQLGFWNGSAPSCRAQCATPDFVEYGSVTLSSSNIAPVIATYSCQNGYLLIGPKQRECIYSISEEIGEWSGIMPVCELGSLIDCNQANCRLTSVDCRYQQGYCSISCNSSMPFACHQVSFDCPLGGSGCYINCASEHQYECLGTNTLCGESGDCIVDCLGPNSCHYSNVSCSRNGQSKINCAGQQTCHYANIDCSEGFSGESSLVSCSGSSSCYYTSSNNARQLECSGFYSCHYATSLITEESVNCSGYSSCQYVNNINTEQLHCSGDYACSYSRGGGVLSVASLNCSGSSSCYYSTFETGQVNCIGASSCYYSTFETGQVNCIGASSCSSATINCPSNSMTCDVNCSGLNSCNNARINCPTGNSPCNIYCTNPLSCSNLRITNTQNVNLRCCGDRSCVGADESPTSTTNCMYR